MALWKAREGKVHKKSDFNHGIVEGKGGGNLNKELEFRSWHCGRQEGGGSLNKELDFRSWHCGRQAN